MHKIQDKLLFAGAAAGAAAAGLAAGGAKPAGLHEGTAKQAASAGVAPAASMTLPPDRHALRQHFAGPGCNWAAAGLLLLHATPRQLLLPGWLCWLLLVLGLVLGLVLLLVLLPPMQVKLWWQQQTLPFGLLLTCLRSASLCKEQPR
jgi:hypothetical protein